MSDPTPLNSPEIKKFISIGPLEVLSNSTTIQVKIENEASPFFSRSLDFTTPSKVGMTFTFFSSFLCLFFWDNQVANNHSETLGQNCSDFSADLLASYCLSPFISLRLTGDLTDSRVLLQTISIAKGGAITPYGTPNLPYFYTGSDSNNLFRIGNGTVPNEDINLVALLPSSNISRELSEMCKSMWTITNSSLSACSWCISRILRPSF